jgi:protein-S-isoprenylcysteine O-methyltransferase Ste14
LLLFHRSGLTDRSTHRSGAGTTEGSMKERNGEHPFGDAGQLILLGVFLVVWAADSFFLHKSTFLSDYLPSWVRLLILGLAVTVALLLFKSGHVVVSHRDRPEGVAVAGAFRFVRHPLYLASILTYLGLTVSTMSIFSFVLLLVIFIFHNYIAGYEEKLLEMKFGEEYRAYRKRTGRWVPRIAREC